MRLIIFSFVQNEILDLGKHRRNLLDKLRGCQVELEAKRDESVKLRQKFKVGMKKVFQLSPVQTILKLFKFHRYNCCSSTCSSILRFHTQRSSSGVRIKRRKKTIISKSEECLQSARDPLCFCMEDRHSSHSKRREVHAP